MGNRCLTAQSRPSELGITQLLGSDKTSVVGPWHLGLSSPITTRLASDQQLPGQGHIQFSGTSVWSIEGGSLDLSGAIIDAPEDRRIFAGSGHVTGLEIARPEWFADASEGVYPASALRAAYAALRPGGTILLREASYVSPFVDPHGSNPCGGSAVKIWPSLTLVGVKRPVPDSESEPTRLVGGTILRGGICGIAVLHASHLGVDVGDFVTEHDFGGERAFGVQLLGGERLGAIEGTTLQDISVLTMGFTNQHSVIIQGQKNPLVENLWIWTPGGDHGLVIKSVASTVKDFHCKGASSDCLILKSDYATDHAGEASGSKVDGVSISYLKTPGDTGGIILEGRWDSLRHLELANIHEDGLKMGIAGGDTGLYRLEDVHIRNWTATKMAGPCLMLHGSVRVDVDQFQCSEAHSDEPWAFYLDGRETTLRNGSIQCDDSRSCGEPGKDGIVDQGRSDRVESVKGAGLGGYLVRTSSHRGGTALESLDASGMGGRSASVYVEPSKPLGERIETLWHATKPYLRISWTRYTTALDSLRPWQRVALPWTVFLLLLLATASVRMRSRRRNTVRRR